MGIAALNPSYACTNMLGAVGVPLDGVWPSRNFAATIDPSLPPAIASADRVLDVADGLLARPHARVGEEAGLSTGIGAPTRGWIAEFCAHVRGNPKRTASVRRRSLTFKNMQGVAQLLIDMRFGHSNVGARIQSTRATDGHR
jgi:hypothetical protein